MAEYKNLDVQILNSFPQIDSHSLDKILVAELAGLNRKIVVLDDDPTGVQTVHDVSIYTDWEPETIEAGFKEDSSMFFVLTNSRGFTVAVTERAHTVITRNLIAASRKTGKDFLIISRGDSTLRGHYPLETETLRKTLEAEAHKKYDGEIIFPFFKEGGRFTINNIHYVKEAEKLVPAGQTEFAKDKSFGYTSSDLARWCEEKTAGKYKADAVIKISLEDLRSLNIEKIASQLIEASDFNKIIVNAVDYCDVKVFAIALVRAMNSGKEYILRSAAPVTKVLGGVPDRPLLSKAELIKHDSKNGGIVIIGSHVNKTTVQLQELQRCIYPIDYIEFNQHQVLTEGGLEKEVERVVALAEERIISGQTVVVFTRRQRLDLPTADPDAQLRISVEISDAVTSIISRLKVRPAFIIAKGGITSSDVGTKALRVKRAKVLGQIQPGVPVWMTGEESKFPGMSYIIFPGNVGEVDTLRKVVEILMD